MPVYNRRDLVTSSADSVLQQTYPDVELVMINDGSTDGSAEVLDNYAIRAPDRVTVIHQKNTGQVVARNNGIAAAKGQYIAFLDSDDTWEHDKLEKQIPLFQDGVGLVYSGIYEVDESGEVVQKVIPPKSMRGDIYQHLLVKNGMTGGSVIVTREALNHVGLFDSELRAAENWDLWIRIAKKYKVDFVSEPLVRYLKHPGNMSSETNIMLQASSQVYAKHLGKDDTDPSLKYIRKQAYAYLFYCSGVSAFGRRDYRRARKEFLTCWRYVPLFGDSFLRYLRTFLGVKANELLSGMRRH